MKFPWRYVLVGAALMAGAMLLAPCGGGEEEASPAASPSVTEEASPALPSPSPTPPVETRAELQALLQAAVLHVEDLPSGFTLDEEEFLTNEEAAESDPIDSQEALDDFNKWGRLLSYEVVYSKGAGLGALLGGTSTISVEVSLYRDADGLRAAVAHRRDMLEDPEWVAKLLANIEGEEYSDARFSMMSFADIGDESLAYQVTAQSSSELVDRVVIQVVHLREDRAAGTIITMAINAASPIEELEGLARKLDERIQAVLKAPPQPGEVRRANLDGTDVERPRPAT